MDKIFVKVVLVIVTYTVISGMSCSKEETAIAQNISSSISLHESPLFTDDSISILADVRLVIQNEFSLDLEKITLELSKESNVNSLFFFNMIYKGVHNGVTLHQEIGRTKKVSNANNILTQLILSKGTHHFQIQTAIRRDADLLSKFDLKNVQFHFKNKINHSLSPVSYTHLTLPTICSV